MLKTPLRLRQPEAGGIPGARLMANATVRTVTEAVARFLKGLRLGCPKTRSKRNRGGKSRYTWRCQGSCRRWNRSPRRAERPTTLRFSDNTQRTWNWRSRAAPSATTKGRASSKTLEASSSPKMARTNGQPRGRCRC